MQYSIELHQEADGRWIAEIPALPGVVAYGFDWLEARGKVQSLALQVLAERLQHAATPDVLPISFRSRKEYDLGVLLVHGIGNQRSGETLTRWGDVLLKTIQHATRHKVVTSVETAGHENSRGRNGREEAVVRLGVGNQRQQWLLSEGWWADAFLAPSYSELVSWSAGALPWSIALHIAQSLWQAGEVDGVLTKFADAAWAVAKLLSALLFVPIFLLFLLLVSVLGLIPVPQLRARILAAQEVLVGSVGDSLAFVESPIRAAMIRTRVIDGLEGLKERCEKTIIVAHSQGAAVVIEALGGIVEPTLEDGELAPEPSTPPIAVPDTLLTFGSGINPLAGLKVLSAGLMSATGLSQVMAFLYVTAGLSAWLSIGHTPLREILSNAGALLVGSVILGYSLWEIRRVMIRRRPKVGGHKISIPVVIILIIISLIPSLFVPRIAGSHLNGRVDLFFFSLIWLVAAIAVFFSKKTRTNVTIVRKPPGLCRWIDLYASSDPVPNGPTMTRNDEREGVTESIKISNSASRFGDHTAYWDNLDEFVLRVVKECAETANSPWRTDLPPDRPGIKERAIWRVRWLQLARYTVTVTWVVLGWIIWHGGFRPEEVKLPFELHRWIPNWLEAVGKKVPAVVVLGVLIVLGLWGTFVLLRLPWRYWVHKEQKALLGHKKPGGGEFYALVGMGIVVWGLFVLGFVVERKGLGGLRMLTDASAWIEGLIQMCSLSVFSVLLLLWLKPAPPMPNGEPRG